MSILKMGQPMQVLVSRDTVEWYTPAEIVERFAGAFEELGRILFRIASNERLPAR